ncbi:MAG: DOMON-like domain-containing protein [Proteobacteria bacterium]|nr:DOMON-like domain-containing protein [Pseudomonadota bacterium]
MRLALHRHPESEEAAVTGVAVEAVREHSGALRLRYEVSGGVGVLMPALRPGARTDELWRHTCFEAFVQAREGYYEFNCSPSTEWAAYRFSAYRKDMTPAELPAPFIEPAADGLHAVLDLSLLPGLDVQSPWRLGLSAILEDRTGAKSYWALAHAPGKPDFHSPHAFALELP